MYCMKCGRETKDNQVFCTDCLADMSAYPVKPGTPVQLPNRPASISPRKAPSRRKGPTPEEQVVTLRKTVRGLAFSMIVLIIVLFLSVAALLRTIDLQKAQAAIGQNYIIADQTDGS